MADGIAGNLAGAGDCPGIRAVVLIRAGRTFIAGAGINQLGKAIALWT